MQSPFARQEPTALPIVIKPLAYCEFRVSENSGEWNQVTEVSLCPVFASEKISGMAFCYQHGQIIQQALEAEGKD